MSDVSVVSLPEHIKALSSNEPETPRIETPLELKPLKHLLSTTRECLNNNFLSSFLSLVGSIMTFHYTSIVVTQDECPLIKRSSPNFSQNAMTRASGLTQGGSLWNSVQENKVSIVKTPLVCSSTFSCFICIWLITVYLWPGSA